MAKIIDDISHTFNEYLLMPGYSDDKAIPANVDLSTPIVRYKKGSETKIKMNIPLVSAVMQSVSGNDLAVALAREGGISFIYVNQTPEQEAEMVRKVKAYKAGFVESNANITPNATIGELNTLKARIGHSTVAVTEDGTKNGKLVGIITSRDYRPSKVSKSDVVSKYMTPFDQLVVAGEKTTLKEANNIIWDHKLNQLPIVDKNGHLLYLVFRKDYENHKKYPNELLDEEKRFVVGAGINTRDYEKRVPLLVEAGVDILCIDSSEGYSAWQEKTLKWVKEHYPNIPCGAGNVVTKEGFRFLADLGADFVKVGIGGGSICITRETKGIGRGQASAVIEVAKERDAYFKEKGVYVPVCSDGGIVYDHHITLALAMGADFVMLGRYFARFDESPSNKVLLNGVYYKEYWGEGSARAKNWQRYDNGENTNLTFVEGVDSYVPYAGALKENVELSMHKVKSTMCNCGAASIKELHEKAVLTLVSESSIKEGGAHDVLEREKIKF